ncbi:MAG TPA: fused response regulator/phosphatase [Synergistaceae bacterium]|nr:fused response regulator/phosphatase [Synergistaceae bacterium]HPJ25042.1 fused response regulator/phosphatase [Synergistaceae bacterium]HPQ36672.1 fused response regulator/phosphatase [Synergistaceae bacterium]
MRETPVILMVDDDAFVRRSMIRVIRKHLGEIRFLEAGDGQEAIDCLESEDVHLLILDLIMPHVDGFGVLEWLQRHREYQDLPVIVNSGNSDWESMRTAFSMGARDYFLKPLTIQQMSVFLPLKIKNALALYENTRILKERDEQIRKELGIARAFQQTLLPPSYGINFEERRSCAYRYIPSRELGGDFFDYVRHGKDAWGILMDVTGHGVGAAMGTGMAKLLFLDALEKADTPGEVLRRMNDSLYSYFGEDSLLSFTALVGRMRGGELLLASAGHPWPLHCDVLKGEICPLKVTGFPIGYFPERNYETYSYAMNSGDSLILSSDGIIDRCGGLEAWHEAVSSLLPPERLRTLEVRGILELLCDGLLSPEEDPAEGDDSTLAVIRWLREDETGYADERDLPHS